MSSRLGICLSLVCVIALSGCDQKTCEDILTCDFNASTDAGHEAAAQPDTGGGADNTNPPPPDSGPQADTAPPEDVVTTDAPEQGDAEGGVVTDAPTADVPVGDAPVADAPAETGPACVLGAACTITTEAGTINGICDGTACAPCTAAPDGGADGGTPGDAQCTAAYGSAGADAGAAKYLCLAGSCTLGECRTSADCPGTICGATNANFCGPCLSDMDCKADPVYPSTMCKIATGTCVPATCSTSGSKTECAANPADICCTAGVAASCVNGNCCTNAECAATPLTPACFESQHLCLPCDPVSGGTYNVDPVNGSDTLGTGSGTAGGSSNPLCALKTVTKAIALIAGPPVPVDGGVPDAADAGTAEGGAEEAGPADGGAAEGGLRTEGGAADGGAADGGAQDAGAPATPIFIKIAGPGPLAAGEQFPLDVPENVTVLGDQGVVTVQIPVSDAGAFRLSHNRSGLSNLIIRGQASAPYGFLSTRTRS